MRRRVHRENQFMDACNGKRSWATFTAARDAASFSKRLDYPFKIYRCRFCQDCHIGSTEPRLRPMPKRQNRPIFVSMEDA